MKALAVILAAVSLLAAFPASAAGTCVADGYTVVFINGVFTDESAAIEDTSLLEKRFRDISGRTDVEIILAHNPTHMNVGGLGAADLLQSMTQALAKPIGVSDKNEILWDIHEQLTTRKVLLVGHSQGTYYTNEVYDYLTTHGVPREAIAVYNVAAMTDSVAGQSVPYDGGYLTSSNDKVVQLVRNLTDPAAELGSETISTYNAGLLGAASTHLTETQVPLPANIEIPLSPEDERSLIGGHAFSDVYLANASGRTIAEINALLNQLEADQGPRGAEGCFSPPGATVWYHIEDKGLALIDGTIGAAGAAWNWTAGTVKTAWNWTSTKTASAWSATKGKVSGWFGGGSNGNDFAYIGAGLSLGKDIGTADTEMNEVAPPAPLRQGSEGQAGGTTSPSFAGAPEGQVLGEDVFEEVEANDPSSPAATDGQGANDEAESDPSGSTEVRPLQPDEVGPHSESDSEGTEEEASPPEVKPTNSAWGLGSSGGPIVYNEGAAPVITDPTLAVFSEEDDAPHLGMNTLISGPDVMLAVWTEYGNGEVDGQLYDDVRILGRRVRADGSWVDVEPIVISDPPAGHIRSGVIGAYTNGQFILFLNTMDQPLYRAYSQNQPPSGAGNPHGISTMSIPAEGPVQDPEETEIFSTGYYRYLGGDKPQMLEVSAHERGVIVLFRTPSRFYAGLLDPEEGTFIARNIRTTGDVVGINPVNGAEIGCVGDRCIVFWTQRALLYSALLDVSSDVQQWGLNGCGYFSCGLILTRNGAAITEALPQLVQFPGGEDEERIVLVWTMGNSEHVWRFSTDETIFSEWENGDLDPSELAHLASYNLPVQYAAIAKMPGDNIFVIISLTANGQELLITMTEEYEDGGAMLGLIEGITVSSYATIGCTDEGCAVLWDGELAGVRGIHLLPVEELLERVVEPEEPDDGVPPLI